MTHFELVQDRTAEAFVIYWPAWYVWGPWAVAVADAADAFGNAELAEDEDMSVRLCCGEPCPACGYVDCGVDCPSVHRCPSSIGPWECTCAGGYAEHLSVYGGP